MYKIELGGRVLFHKYKDSLYSLLSSVYPEHDWLAWRFSHTPRGYWDSIDNQKKFMDWVFTKLNYKDMGDWYRVTGRVIY